MVGESSISAQGAVDFHEQEVHLRVPMLGPTFIFGPLLWLIWGEGRLFSVSMTDEVSSRPSICVILTLRDRQHFTRQYMTANVSWSFRYLIIDASEGDANQAIVQANLRSNIQYFRVPVDLSLQQHVKKLKSFLDRLDTDYVMLTDNDDFLIPKGVTLAAEALERDQDAVAAGGPVLGFKGRGHPTKWMSFPYVVWNPPTSHDALSSVISSRSDYQSIWYSVYRRKVLSTVLKDVLDFNVQDPYMIEFAACDLTFSYGSYINSAVPHYARLSNQSDRAILSKEELGECGWQHRNWFRESESFDGFLAEKISASLDSLPTNALRWALLSNVASTNSNFWHQVGVYLRLITSSLTILPQHFFVLLLRVRHGQFYWATKSKRWTG